MLALIYQKAVTYTVIPTGCMPRTGFGGPDRVDSGLTGISALKNKNYHFLSFLDHLPEVFRVGLRRSPRFT